jgi:hypothetical protein
MRQDTMNAERKWFIGAHMPVTASGDTIFSPYNLQRCIYAQECHTYQEKQLTGYIEIEGGEFWQIQCNR